MKNLVIGLGQIGSAIQEVLLCDGLDTYKGVSAKEESYDTLHICIPYSSDFIPQVKLYQDRFGASLTIVHSTVPVGTSLALGSVSSPVRGVHPHLLEGVLTFIKYFGGEQADEAAKIFTDCGIVTHTHHDSRTIEAMKLWDTTGYGLNIILEKAIYEYCQKYNMDFDLLYRQSNLTYNEGYAKLGMSYFTKYVLSHKDGPIGGHCVVNNCDLLDSWVADLIKDKNNSLK